MKQASAEREIFFPLKRDGWWERGKVCKRSGDKYLSYCITISKNGKKRKNYRIRESWRHSIVVTSNVYLDLMLLELFNVNNGFGFFSQVHFYFTHDHFLNCKSCVACFQVYQRCRSLGTMSEPQPQLSRKDLPYTSRQGIQLNFWEEMHTVCFGRYYPNYHFLRFNGWFIIASRIKLVSLETDCMLSASEILHDVENYMFKSLPHIYQCQSGSEY